MRVKLWMMTAVLLGSSTLLRAQTSSTVKDDLFAGTEKFATNASSVTEVDMDPDSMSLVNGHNSDRARRTVLSVVHTYSYDKPGMYNMADVDAFRNKLNTGDWHCSVHVRELKSGESTDVCNKHRTDDLIESAIITVEPRELTFIHTIKRPPAAGKPGGGDSFLTMPMDFGNPGFSGMPAVAWSAQMRANAAEMRAQAVIDRAEMAGMPGFRMGVFDGEPMPLVRMPAIDTEDMRNLQRELNAMPRVNTEQMRQLQRELKAMPPVDMNQFSPWWTPQPPAAPAAPAKPSKPSKPSKPTPMIPLAPQAPSPA